MNPRCTLFVGLVTLIIGHDTIAAERTIVVGLPSAISTADRTPVFKAVIDLMLTVQSETRVLIFNAQAQTRICDVEVTGTSKRGRLRRLAREVAIIKRYFKRTDQGQEAVIDNVHVPAFLSVLRHIQLPGSSLRILLFGSLYHSAVQDIHATFGPGFVPSDGHVLAMGRESVFGTADLKGSLDGVAIDWCYLGHNGSTLERRAVVRFWTIYFSEMGMALTSVLSSPHVTIDNVISGSTDPAFPDRIDRRDRRIEIRPVDSPPKETRVRPDRQPLEETAAFRRHRMALEDAAKSVPKPRSGFLSIAAVWISKDPNVDVDLWVRPHSRADELYFQKQETPEGRHLRDVVTAHSGLGDADWQSSWELVEVRMATLEDATCWLNLYKGGGETIEGIVRLLFDHRVVDVPFSFTGGKGDKAKGRNHRENSPFWISIDVAELWSNGPDQ